MHAETKSPVAAGSPVANAPGSPGLALSVGLLLLVCCPALGADVEWKAGLAQVKITPAKPVFLERFPDKFYEKVESDLYVKAMVLQDPNGFRAVLLTCDLLGFRYEEGKKITDQIQAKTGLKRTQILLNCSLAHNTPMLGHPTRLRGTMTEADQKWIGEYSDQLSDRFCDVVVQAQERLQPARLSWGVGKVNFVMNRRQATPRGVIQGTNPNGPVDRSVPVLRVDAADGKPLAVVFGAAATPATLGNKNVLCADYPGFAQAHVQEKFPGAQAMFVLGCAGSANAHPSGTVELAKEHGTALGKEVCRVLETDLTPVRGPLRVVYTLVQLPLVTPTHEELENQVKQGGDVANRALRLLKITEKGYKLPTHQTHPFAVWQFGADLTLVALPGQVVAEYVPLIEKAIGPNHLWLSGNCNDLVGYHIPTARILEEEGLEARGFFTPKVEETVVGKVRELAMKVAREVSSK